MLSIVCRRLMLIALLLAVACVSTPIKQTPLPSPLISPLNTLALTATPAPTLSPPTITPTSPPTAAPTPTGIAPPPGLIYRTSDGLWQIEAGGQATQILDQPDAVLSPDGVLALYPKGYPVADELWLVDLTTGHQRNLITNHDRPLCCIQWWPARPKVILFSSWPTNNLGDSIGFLTALELDSGKMHVLDEKGRSDGSFAPSPDGQSIAYHRGGQAWLYEWNGKLTLFDPTRYGLSNIQRIASPSWSPNSNQIAWIAGGDFDGVWKVGIAVFDLEKRTGRWLHPYEPVGRGVWFPAASWSLDGRWLAFTAEDQDPSKRGAWVVRVDAQEEHTIPLGLPRVWSADGQWLISGGALIEVGTWRTQQLALPQGAQVIGWITLPK